MTETFLMYICLTAEEEPMAFHLSGPEKEQLEKQMRDEAFGKPIEETEETTALHLTRDEFVTRMRKEPDGQSLLDLMEDGEWRICERMGLSNGYYLEGVPYIDVPGWNNLVAHLRIVNGV